MDSALAPSAVKFGELTFNLAVRRLERVSGIVLDLTPELTEILGQLAAAQGRVVTKEEIYLGICQRSQGMPEPKIADVQICHLHKTLDGFSAGSGDHIVTVWGEGYRLSPVAKPRKEALTQKRGARARGVGQRLESIFLGVA
jgi:DNA-binding response OmpR family regulator